MKAKLNWQQSILLELSNRLFGGHFRVQPPNLHNRILLRRKVQINQSRSDLRGKGQN